MTTDLDSIITHYHSLLDEALARETFATLDAEQHARGLLIGLQRDRLICPVLRPRFITRAQYETLTRAASLVGRAVRAVSAAALTDPTILAPYRLTPAERELLAIDPGTPAQPCSVASTDFWRRTARGAGSSKRTSSRPPGLDTMRRLPASSTRPG